MDINTENKTNVIADELIDEIDSRLIEGKQVRRTLPFKGRLHIDRTLPFLVVHRIPTKNEIKGSEQLVMSEASYLIASNNKALRSSLMKLTKRVVETLSQKCGAFLIIEIWADRPENKQKDLESQVVPKFNVHISDIRPPAKSVETLEKALKAIKIQKKSAEIRIYHEKKPTTHDLPPIISSAIAKKYNCFYIGLEVKPIYADPINNEQFPLVLRSLQRSLSRSIKKTVFSFTKNYTNQSFPNYQALGRRAMVKAVWEVDRQLSDISQSFDLLLQITPINSNEAWGYFQRKKFDKTPTFYYRPLPIDPALYKHKLYQIRIDNIEDPSLVSLFTDKRLELDRQLTLLIDRGKPEFVFGSMQLYGVIGEELLNLAKKILTSFPARSRENSIKNTINSTQFAEIARKELEYYRQIDDTFSSNVTVRDDVVGLLTSHGRLLVGKDTRIPKSRVNALIQHEIGTHILTYFNGQSQPLKQLYSGLAGYEALQEGMAVLAEYFVDALSSPRIRLLAARVLAAHSMTKGATFIDVFRELNSTYGFNKRIAFTIAFRIFRGGGLTKDAIYLRGLVEVLSYIRNGGDYERLFVGKISTKHISIIQELHFRKVLNQVKLLPRYFENHNLDMKIDFIKSGASPLDLVNRRLM